jgi:hypothetical protein
MDTTLPQTYALLIGIDHYLPNTLPSDEPYEDLKGCVRDVLRIEEFLKSRLTFPDGHIITLIAPNDTIMQPPSTQPSQLPTYNNIVAAFQQLLKMARSGDWIYVYFAGHGARASSLVREAKEIDEVLVPMDIGTPQGRYLHDVELAYLLKEMDDARLIVTVIFDSCFSGGTTRGLGGVTVRGVSNIDRHPRPGTSLVASPQALMENWRRLPKGVARRFRWFPDARGYVLLAACRATEQAYEYPLDGYDGHGVFTYWLLDSLQHIGPGSTYRMLHSRVRAQIHAQFEQQTPLILGEADRLVFGNSVVQTEYAVDVLRVDMDQRQILLNAGEVQTVGKGSTFAIYPAEVIDFSQSERCQAIVEVIHPGGINSWARIVDMLSSDPLEPGARAVLRDPGNIRLQRLIRLVPRNDLPTAIEQDRALNSVEQAIRQQQNRFVRLAEPHEAVDYQVAINAEGAYEIWDPAGVPVHNLRPALSIHENHAAEKLVRRLVHLTKYCNIQQLENTDNLSPLMGKLLITLLGKQENYVLDERPAPEPFDETDGNPVLRPAEWTFLSIKNASSLVVNVTVFNLAADWSIAQVFPYDESYHTLAAGEDCIVDLQAELPHGHTHVTDILKVFATIGSTDFQWLQLPPLDQPTESRGISNYTPVTPLEALLFAIMEDAPDTRTLKPGVRPGREWITVELEVDVQE